MKTPTTSILTALLLCGCASARPFQKDTSYDPETGKKVREIVTRSSIITLFESKSQLSKFKQTTTDKTQSTSIGSLAQEADALSALTNAAPVVKAVFEGIVSGAIKTASPIPLPKKEEEPAP